MGRKKKASTQPEEERLLFDKEQNSTTPESSQSNEDSTGGETKDNSQTGAEQGSSTNVDGNSNNNTSTESSITPELRSKINSAIDKLRDTYMRLGGEEGTKKRKELMLALFKYKSVDEALTRFREVLGKTGFLGLEREQELIPIVEYYGTIKDKTALVVNSHWDMTKEEGKTPLMTRKRVDDIRNDIRSQGYEAMKEFMTYLAMFDSIKKVYHLYYRLKYSYLSMAYQSTIYFQTYEWLGKAEELFNSFASLVDPNKREEFSKLAQDYNTYLQSYQRFGELEEVKGEGWIDKQRDNCLTYADVITTDFCRKRLADFKGAVVGIDKWIAYHKVEMFIPMELREQRANLHYAQIQELQSKYYFSHLKYMEDHGETPTDADKKIALFPEYDEVEPNEEVTKYIYKQLDGYKQKIQQ